MPVCLQYGLRNVVFIFLEAISPFVRAFRTPGGMAHSPAHSWIPTIDYTRFQQDCTCMLVIFPFKNEYWPRWPLEPRQFSLKIELRACTTIKMHSRWEGGSWGLRPSAERASLWKCVRNGEAEKFTQLRDLQHAVPKSQLKSSCLKLIQFNRENSQAVAAIRPHSSPAKWACQVWLETFELCPRHSKSNFICLLGGKKN